MNPDKTLLKKLTRNFGDEFLPPWPASAIVLTKDNFWEDAYVTQNGIALLQTPFNDILIFQTPDDLELTIAYLKRIRARLAE